MSKPVSIKKLSAAIATLGKEADGYQITTDMTIMDVLSKFISHEREKAEAKAEAGMFDDDTDQEAVTE